MLADVYTGTLADGTKAAQPPAAFCDDWSGTSGQVQYGRYVDTTESWIQAFPSISPPLPCGVLARLYCISQ